MSVTKFRTREEILAGYSCGEPIVMHVRSSHGQEEEGWYDMTLGRE
jgi:hypothetical protein